MPELELSAGTIAYQDVGWCGAQVMIADGLMERAGRLVLVSCEAFDNYPPGLAGWMAVWAAEDRLMPPEHGRRLAHLFRDSRLVEMPDSYTLVPEDQPAQLAAQLRTLIARPGLPRMRTS